jgi:molybdenum cofactor cytidylyltransferase
VLLAAGSSSRLGRPKQLLQYNGKSLLSNAVDVAAAASVQPLVVVIGANSDQVISEVDTKNAFVVTNKNWAQGMASSIVCGLSVLLQKQPDADGAIFMMCDQPFVNTDLLKNLITTWQQTGKPIVASSYETGVGTPALFDKVFFAELLQLKGDTGARKIIRQHTNEVATVLFAEGNIDIDTEEDYGNLLKKGI